MTEILSELSTAIIAGNLDEIADLTQEALDDGMTAKQILDQGLMPGMDHVGAEFKAGNMFVPEVLRSARAMQASMAVIKPLLAETGAKMTGKILLGTVKGDLHDIGKNLVVMMCEGAGEGCWAGGVCGGGEGVRTGCGGDVGVIDDDDARDGAHAQGVGGGGGAGSD